MVLIALKPNPLSVLRYVEMGKLEELKHAILEIFQE